MVVVTVVVVLVVGTSLTVTFAPVSEVVESPVAVVVTLGLLLFIGVVVGEVTVVETADAAVQVHVVVVVVRVTVTVVALVMFVVTVSTLVTCAVVVLVLAVGTNVAFTPVIVGAVAVTDDLFAIASVTLIFDLTVVTLRGAIVTEVLFVAEAFSRATAPDVAMTDIVLAVEFAVVAFAMAIVAIESVAFAVEVFSFKRRPLPFFAALII